MRTIGPCGRAGVCNVSWRRSSLCRGSAQRWEVWDPGVAHPRCPPRLRHTRFLLQSQHSTTARQDRVARQIPLGRAGLMAVDSPGKCTVWSSGGPSRRPGMPVQQLPLKGILSSDLKSSSCSFHPSHSATSILGNLCEEQNMSPAQQATQRTRALPGSHRDSPPPVPRCCPGTGA